MNHTPLLQGAKRDGRWRSFLWLAGLLAAGFAGLAHGQHFDVTTWAGAAGRTGYADGAQSVARFSGPAGVAVDSTGCVYVADTGNSTIRKISPGGAVTTLAGTNGATGSIDATGRAARFNKPAGVAVDGDGNVYVADTGNSTLRRITPDGEVTTLAGSAGVTGSVDGVWADARFAYPEGVAVDAAGNIYVADTGNSIIRKLSPTGTVTTLAGTAGKWGNVDGTGSAVRFNRPTGLAVDGSGNVYVAEPRHQSIRKISPGGVVTTLAGSLNPLKWAKHGYSEENDYRYACINAQRSRGARSIFYTLQNTSEGRNLYTSGKVVLGMYILGTPSPLDGHRTDDWVKKCNSAGITTQIPILFNSPDSYAGKFSEHDAYMKWMADSINWAPSSQFIVCMSLDVDRNQQISAAWTPEYVNLLAGRLKQYTGRRFPTAIHARYPQCIAWGKGSDIDIIYVETVQPWSATEMARILAEVKAATGKTAEELTTSTSVDAAGRTARFLSPEGVAADAAGNLYVADKEAHTIRAIDPAVMVTTPAGSVGSAGSADGVGNAARFNRPDGVAAAPSGMLFVADSLNSTIRRGLSVVETALLVVTPYGKAFPPAGPNWFKSGSTLTAVISNSPATIGTAQYVCRGWKGTGSVPASGATNSTGPFELTTDSSISWLWSTNYWLDTGVSGSGSLSVADGWQADGSVVYVTCTPAAGWAVVAWSGNTAGCTSTGNTLIVPMTGPRTISAQLAPAGALPTVQLTSPTNGAAFLTSETVPLTAVAAGPGGGWITQVVFRVNGLPIGPALSAGPYTCNWKAALPGSYDLTAAAWDNLGQCVVSPPVTVAVKLRQKINCGGVATNEWSADRGYSGGSSYKVAAVIAGATNAPAVVYQTLRYGTSFAYSLADVPDGAYIVRLHFAETYFTGPGQAVFNLDLEGQRVLTNFDVFAEAGGKNRALVKEFNVTVAGGNGLQLGAQVVKGTTRLNGLEIVSAPPRLMVTSTNALTVPEGGSAAFQVRLEAAPDSVVTVNVGRVSGDADLNVASGASLVFTPANWSEWQTVELSATEDPDEVNDAAVIGCSAAGFVTATVRATEKDNDVRVERRINCGGVATGAWAADRGYSGGSSYKVTAVIAGATNAPAAVYQTLRYGTSFAYSLADVPDGSYIVRLHFAETYFTGPGQAVFNLDLEGRRVLTNFDVFAEAGGKNRALVKEFSVTVADGNGLQLSAQVVKGTTRLNGLEIVSAPPAGALLAVGADAPHAASGMAAGGPMPDRVVTSEDTEDVSNGWYTVDGDTNTVWSGAADGGVGWVVLGYDSPLLVSQVEVQLADGPARDVAFLGSEDGTALYDVAGQLARTGQARLCQLWIVILPGTGGAPAGIREIRVQGIRSGESRAEALPPLPSALHVIRSAP